MLKELNLVIDYIEDHLTEELSLENISNYAGVSDYHFRNIFFYLSGWTLSEYIKNRRLSEANKDLLNAEKVTDVAFKYGYQSVDGFTRAFKKWSGFLPPMF
ncbi:helix-turn-helix transcriptional regulator [Salibacterium salarium]|uniref:helix-turn-helix transcriptional regulator n=1 Tax=Salibacterium salarium TaxID=284579 RepID=UPI0026B37DD8